MTSRETQTTQSKHEQEKARGQELINEFIVSRKFPIERFFEVTATLEETDMQRFIFDSPRARYSTEMQPISPESFMQDARGNTQRAHKMHDEFLKILHARITRDLHSFTKENEGWEQKARAKLTDEFAYTKKKLDTVFVFLRNSESIDIQTALNTGDTIPGLHGIDSDDLSGIISAICTDQAEYIENFKESIRKSLLDLKALAKSEVEIQEGQTIDPLTGLMNKPGMIMHLDESRRQLQSRYEQWQKSDTKDEGDRPILVLIHFDINDFKSLNTNYTHDRADLILAEIAKKIQGSIRVDAGDSAARMGGDEFCIVLHTTAQQTKKIKTRFSNILEIHPPEGEDAVPGYPEEIVYVSGGIVEIQHDSPKTFTQLLEVAEIAGFTRKMRKSEGTSGLAIYNEELRKGVRAHIENEENFKRFAGLYARMLLDRLIKQAENQSSSTDPEISTVGKENEADYADMLVIQTRITERNIGLALEGKSDNDTLNTLLGPNQT